MALARRSLLRLLGSACMLATLPGIARADAYPSRPVHIIVGFAAGSAADIVTRLIAQSLSQQLGQPFVIENRGGAGGSLANEALLRAVPDGYTLVFCGSSDTINATLREKSTFDFFRDIAPVASIAHGPLVLVAHPSFPAKTVPEFIAYAKKNPGKITFASAGVGSLAEMAGELFMAMAGVKLVHVPYRGLGSAMTDLLSGQVQTIFSTMPPALAHVRAGKLRALAVTSNVRSEALPELPTIGDFLPGYQAVQVLGLGAPKQVPAGMIAKLSRAVNAALADPAIKARLDDLGDTPAPMTSAEFAKLLTSEADKWGRVIRTAGIKPE